MAIIPLRAYNREIEGMIDNGQLDEAVAHCRHILATFPKHIASYRLLGKAHLEQQRISDATDIFQRVLSSVPDDFIANAGMSIIREDENNLDASIWHMELAYEAQPANVAIQDELRRLYGRRDGMQPLKVRLTRGALARMYAKGGLFDQAIAELRAAISEDPNRTDLQLILAQMYFETSQRVEAVETCANILKKLPYCLEANRILAVSLPDAERSEAGRNYRQTVISMDPYYAFAAPEAITSDQVPDNAVNIERLDWKSGLQVQEAPAQPNWATSLGISIENQADENVPDWLKSADAPIQAPSGDADTSNVSPFIWDTQEVNKIITEPSKSESEIPDWMKDAGWQPSSGEVAPGPETPKSEEPGLESPESQELEKAEFPEWLQGIAPEGVLGVEKQAPQPGESDLSTPWLEQHQPGPSDSIIHWLEDNKPETPKSRRAKDEAAPELSEEEIPDWLKDLEPAQPSAASEETPPATPAFTIEPSAFLEETKPPETIETGIPPEEKASATPEKELPPSKESVIPEAIASVDTGASDVDEIPDWLRELAGELPAPETLVPPQEVSSAEEPQVSGLEPASEVPISSEEGPGEELPPHVEEIPAAESLSAEELPAVEVPRSVEELPVAESLPVHEELPTVEVPPTQEGVPAREVAPVVEAPLPQEVPPVSEEMQAIEELPPQEVLPVSEVVPTSEEIPPQEVLPVSEVVPTIEEFPPQVALPVSEEIPAVEELPTQEVLPVSEEVPAVEELSSQEGLPVSEEAPVVEIPAVIAEVLPVILPASEEEPATAEEAVAGEVIPHEEVSSVMEETPKPELPTEIELPSEAEVPVIFEEQPTVEVPVQPVEEPVSELLPIPTEQLQPQPPLAVEGEPATPEPVIPGEPEPSAWLEGLVGEQTAKEEALPVPSEAGEILPPEWVQLDTEPPMDETLMPESKTLEPTGLPAEEVPEWIKGLGEEPKIEPTSEEPEAVPAPEVELPQSEELPAWLRELEEPEPEKGEAEPTEVGLQWKSDELPAWLKEITETEPSTEPTAAVEAPASQQVPLTAVEPASQWTAEATPPAGIKKEALQPAPEETVAAEPVIQAAEQPAPPIPAEVTATAIPVGEEQITPPPEIPVSQPEVSFEAFQAISIANQASLSKARNAITQGQPTQAAELYAKLIKQNYHLDEIIKDLQDGLYRFPVDIDMWVTLGDAHIRMDDLQEALSAYTKAEELLR